MGAKIQVARNLAGTISRVQDRLLRGEVVNRASARLGIDPADFESLLEKHARASSRAVSSSSPDTYAVLAPPHDIAMLCLLALRDESARNFLRAQRWREILEQVPDTDILVRILDSELQPDEAASLNAFMATLSQGEERLVSSWLLQKTPVATEKVVEQWWRGICQGVVRRRLEIAKNQIKVPGLSAGEVVNLQKQILDLQGQLHEFHRPAGGADI